MNFPQRSGFANSLWILHSKLQPTHIVHVLGGGRFARPGRNVRGVTTHADGSKEESEEEDRQEEDEEVKKEEVNCVDTVNACAADRSCLSALNVGSEGKGRGPEPQWNRWSRPSPQRLTLQPRLGAVFFWGDAQRSGGQRQQVSPGRRFLKIYEIHVGWH